jgi:serine/threonine-protein kinase
MSDPAREFSLRQVGRTLANKWTIDRFIDMGGMAAVFAATHRNGKRVAIKMLLPAFAEHDEVRARFLREGYVANQVDHPGAVSVLDDDVADDGSPFLVMELLEGESLDQWLHRVRTVPVADVLAVADQALDVLAAFHARGVIHRDIKPGNLFVTKPGVLKVLDFGLARLRDAKGIAATAAGVVVGTAAYMPPEQAQGKSAEVDHRCDIFAVGAVMFRALTGRAIHEGTTPMARLIEAMRQPAPPVAQIAPSVPASVAAIVDRALAFEKASRWPSAVEMRAAVRATFGQLKEEAARIRTAPGSVAPASDDDSIEISEIFDAIIEPSVIVDASFADIKVEF